MCKIIVEKIYNNGEGSEVIIDKDELKTGVFFGKSQSYLLDKKISIEDYEEQLLEDRNLSITEYLEKNNIGYYTLYTDTADYKSYGEIEELEKEYPYYLNLDGAMEIYENKGLLYNFEEVNYFTYYNANNNLEIVEIKEEYKEIK